MTEGELSIKDNSQTTAIYCKYFNFNLILIVLYNNFNRCVKMRIKTKQILEYLLGNKRQKT